MLYRHALLMTAAVITLTVPTIADPPHSRSGLGGGGHHALTGGGRHALGGGHYHADGHHHHHHGNHFHGGGYYGNSYFGGLYSGFGGFYSGPGYFSYSAPGYSFFSGTTTVLPAPVWSPPAGGGYYYGAPGYYLDPYGPAIERPGVFDPVPADEQAVFDDWVDENRAAWEDPIEQLPIEQRPERFITPSSTAAQVRGIRLQHEGDLLLKNLQYNVAARRYREAIAAAPDRAEPYFRLGVAAAADGDFVEAVRQMKFGLQLDAGWPRTAVRLDELLGNDNLLARTLVKQRVADWTREDIRDPDRLFLLGVLLHLDGDERSQVLFESAARLGGMSYPLAAFLRGDELLPRAEAQTDDASPLPAAGPELEQPPLLPPPPAP